MFRKYMIFTLAALMIGGFTGCTSNKASDETADMEQGSGDDAIESAEATENNDDLATDSKTGDAVADLGGTNDDLSPDEKLAADTPPAASPADTAAAPTDVTETTPPPTTADQAATPPPDAGTPPPANEMAAADKTPPPAADSAAPPMDAATPPPDAAAPPPEPVAAADSAPKASGSLRKIDTTPRHQGKMLLNAVYIARAGDSPESISQKVFGSNDHVKALCKANSYNCSRATKVGDKFYYTSPQRPTDETVVKVFYEDAGIAPSFYTAKGGDNIRGVGKTLLGDSRSWMELWATNDVESKGDLDEGTKLRYWPNQETPAPTQALAQTDAAKPQDSAGAANQPPGGAQAANVTPPPPDAAAQAQAANTPPPPPPAGNDNLPPAPDQAANPPPQAAAAGTVEPPPPPPPPPPAEAAQGPQKAPAAVDGASPLSDPNQTLAVGVGAVLLLAAAALFISIRKKRARRQIDFSNTTTQTQID